MAWLRVDDRVRTHPKIVTAGHAAAWFWFCGICYCREHLTDGFIPDGMLASLAPGVTNGKTLAAKLVSVVLWHQVEGGYQVHDFLDWNPARAEVLTKRAVDLERKKGGKGVGFRVESERNPDGFHDGIRTESTATRDARTSRAGAGLGLGSGSELDLGSSEGGVGETKSGEKHTALRARFERFWAVYPRKVGKDAAWQVWQRRAPGDDLSNRMIAAVEAQKRDPQWLKDGGQFIPHPRTWLSQGRWQDEGVSDPRADAVADGQEYGRWLQQQRDARRV